MRTSPLAVAGLISLLALLAGRPVHPKERDTSQDLIRWWQGPVRYIAEEGELKTFRKLETDEERALFTEKFWAKRDPTPDTLTNETRQIFWERVNNANDLFWEGTKEGWKTDRGKVYVLYGPPTDMENLYNLRSGGDLTAGQGVIRWFYQGRPGGRTDVDPVVIVPFERQTTGEWRLSTKPELASIFFNPLRYAEETPMQRVAENMFGTPAHSQLSVMLDLGKMQEVPPHAQVLLERVETTESYRTRPVEAVISRYWHPDRAAPMIVVTVDVSEVATDVQPAIVARFVPRDATRETQMLGEDSFQSEIAAGRRVAQGRLVIAPGDYDLTVMVVDPMSNLPGVVRQSISVPRPAAQLRLSDVVLANKLQPLRYAALASWDEPFHLGPFLVVPRASDTFVPGDTVRLFYEIYGGQPPYRIAYKLEGQDLDGSWVGLGQPSEGEQSDPAQAWELPTSSRWPLGAYRIVIDVQDNENRLVSVHTPFKLDGPEG